MIAAIEDAIIARLKQASAAGTLGYALRSVASYGGEFDDDRLREVVKNYPAVWVAFAGEARPEELGGNRWKYRPVFVVMVAARSLRNEAAARRGAGQGAGLGVGSYQMKTDVRALLSGQDLGLEIEGLAPGAARPLFDSTTRNLQLSVMAQEFHTAYEDGAADAGAGQDDFLSFHADWDVPAHGNVAPPLPAAEADAEDTVTLPGP